MAGTKGSGRKGYGQELQIIRRYSDLSAPFFGFLKNKLENGTDDDKWKATDILKGAFAKMIPQDITSEGEKLNVGVIFYPQKDGEDTLETPS